MGDDQVLRFALVLFTTLISDQILKYYVFTHLLVGQSIPVLPPVFYITLVLNPGAAFGILAHNTNFFILVSAIIIIAVLVGLRYLPREMVWSRLALGLIVGGAAGNFIDRVRLGRVIDFLDFRFWPVFNLADIAIVVGALILLVDIWRMDKLKAKGMDAGAL